MIHYVKVLVLTVALSGFWGNSTRAQGADIQSTISQQIDAFQVDDFETAFGFASPTLRQLLGSSENFRTMVTRGYPMVWRPAEVRYLELAEINGSLWQKVLIKDQTGVVHVLGYRMLETEKGWKINGVQLLKAPDVGA